MEHQSYYAVAVLLTVLHYSDSQVSIKGCSEPISGEFCRLICITTDFVENVIFIKSSTTTFQGGCDGSGSCDSLFEYDVHQNSSGSLFETYLDIQSLNYTTENDTWSCYYGTTLSPNGVPIIVHTVPSNMTIDLQTSATPQTIIGRGHCVYPNDVVMKLIYQGDEGQEEELGTFSISNSVKGFPGCEEHEYQVTGSYKLTQSQISSTLTGKSVRFKTRITVADLSMSQESEWTSKVDYQGTTKPVPSPTTTPTLPRTPDSPSSGWQLWYTIVIVIGGVVVLGIGSVIGIYCCRKKITHTF